MMPTKVLLCDTGDGLGLLEYALLKADLDLELEVVTDGLRAVEIAARSQPEVVVAEIGLEGLSGTQLVRRLIATVPETRVICWTALPSPVTAAAMLEAGASGFLFKEDGPEAVIRGIRAVLDGNVVLSHRVSQLLAERFVDSVRHQRELEATVSDTTERLEHLTTAKAEFLANISHELRTPITVAKGIAYVLKNRGIPEEEQREFLDQLESSLEKLMILVDEMLTMAEIDRGRLTLKLSEIDIAPILRHLSEEMARQYPSVSLEMAIPDSLLSLADPIRISEVVRQLLDNACRYSPEGQPVQLRGRNMEEGIVVSVTDRGTGIAREIVSQAFAEPFSTGEETLRKERSGAGVGLHMARQLVLQHGGIIWADPLPGGGTRVSFCLPGKSGEPVVHKPVLTAEGLNGTADPIPPVDPKVQPTAASSVEGITGPADQPTSTHTSS